VSTAVGIFSVKGGVGKSLVAVNLGTALAHHLGFPILVIDLQPCSGSDDLLLNVQPEHSWEDLLPVAGELSRQHVALGVERITDSLDFLAAPQSFQGEDITPDIGQSWEALLAGFQDYYQFIIGDGYPVRDWDDLVFNCFDFILMVVTPDGPALRATSRFLNGIDDELLKIGVIINQWSSRSAVSPREAAEHLNCPLVGVLPIDPKAAWENIHFGQPCVNSPRSRLGKSFRSLIPEFLDWTGNHPADRSEET